MAWASQPVLLTQFFFFLDEKQGTGLLDDLARQMTGKQNFPVMFLKKQSCSEELQRTAAASPSPHCGYCHPPEWVWYLGRSMEG
jgi:hypothetical protein